MRTRTLRLGLLAYFVFMIYLVEANILRQVGVANLPATFETNALESYIIMMTLLIMLLLGVFASWMLSRNGKE